MRILYTTTKEQPPFPTTWEKSIHNKEKPIQSNESPAQQKQKQKHICK